MGKPSVGSGEEKRLTKEITAIRNLLKVVNDETFKLILRKKLQLAKLAKRKLQKERI